MPDQAEITRALYGAYRLARLDLGGLALFDTSVDGFWKSFFALVLSAPPYALLVGHTMTVAPEDSFGWILLVEAGTYVLSWAIFPILAFFVTDSLNLGRRYTTLVVAVNWAAVIQIAAFVVAVGLAAILPEGPANSLMLVMTFAILFYQWFVTWAALGSRGVLDGGIALALVVIELLLNIVLNMSADRLV